MPALSRLSMSVLLVLAAPALASAQESGLPAGMAADLEQKKSAEEITEALTRGLAISPGAAEEAAEPEPAPAAEPETAVAAPAEPAAERPSIALRITFAFDSDRLTPQAQGQLDELARAMADPRLASSRLRLDGHTDSVGSAGYNQSLSERRARAAAAYLRERHGIAFGRLQTRGLGERAPLPGLDPAADAQRRVVVTNLGG